VFNLLLQVSMDGRLTDSQGRTWDLAAQVVVYDQQLEPRALERGAHRRTSRTAKQTWIALMRPWRQALSPVRQNFLNRHHELDSAFPRFRRRIYSASCAAAWLSSASLLAEKQLELQVEEAGGRPARARATKPEYGSSGVRRCAPPDRETPGHRAARGSFRGLGGEGQLAPESAPQP